MVGSTLEGSKISAFRGTSYVISKAVTLDTLARTQGHLSNSGTSHNQLGSNQLTRSLSSRLKSYDGLYIFESWAGLGGRCLGGANRCPVSNYQKWGTIDRPRYRNQRQSNGIEELRLRRQHLVAETSYSDFLGNGADDR
jgi:hypothetical protein